MSSIRSHSGDRIMPQTDHSLILPLILVVSCAVSPIYSAGASAAEMAQDSAQEQTSGIKGKVFRGPVRPGPQTETEPDELPFRALFHVRDTEGNEVGRFESNDDGEFEIVLAPGDYLIVPDETAPLMAPTNQAHKVEVREGEVVEVTLRFDTGIR